MAGSKAVRQRTAKKRRAKAKEARRQKALSDKQKRIKGEIGMLCKTDEHGNVLKSYITVDNFKRIKALMNTLDIEVLQATHDGKRKSFSYRQYCKLFESYIFKSKKCNGQVCCQAITEDGKRCKRPASRFSTLDITETQILSLEGEREERWHPATGARMNIPGFIREKLGTKKFEKLKLLGFANTCCFYCWQHAAMFVGEKVTWATNILYYTTHPEDIFSIFYDDVKVSKFLGTVTFYVDRLGELRTPNEIIKHMFRTYGITHGSFSTTYWAVFGMVFMYDTLKQKPVKYLSGSPEEVESTIEEMSETAADVLLELQNQ